MPKLHLLFYMIFHFRSLQGAILKFAEYVDVLVLIIYAKFKNDGEKDYGYSGYMRIRQNI